MPNPDKAWDVSYNCREAMKSETFYATRNCLNPVEIGHGLREGRAGETSQLVSKRCSLLIDPGRTWVIVAAIKT